MDELINYNGYEEFKQAVNRVLNRTVGKTGNAKTGQASVQRTESGCRRRWRSV